ncbi:MAG: tyrosine-protein phosphatase [Actinobacteria bacterium]|nr:tyrosine-protein phosphatase [Actinomycetota bacterium]
MGDPAGRVPLEGLHNFRDLGGHATADGRRLRRGRVYRSDALHRMTAADVQEVRALGIVSVVDLRAPDEVAHVGTGLIDDLDARYHNLPTRPAVLGADAPSGEITSAPERYLGYLSEGPGSFAGLITLLADPAHTPAVFFCNAGKDRTGVAAAMVLAVCGVPDAAIADDYARTQSALDAIRAASRTDYPADVKAWRNLSPDMAHARAETMLAFLGLLRERMGGWPEYLASLGVDAATLHAVRQSLLERPGDDDT